MKTKLIYALILTGVFTILCGLVFYKLIDQEIPEKPQPCQNTEWVQVTHRDGFWYCHDDNTASWNGEWKPATQFEKRRVGL